MGAPPPVLPADGPGGPVPAVEGAEYRSWVEERRRSLRTRHEARSRLYARDLALWMGCVGALGLGVALLIRMVASPATPEVIKPVALLVLAVTFGMSLFSMAAAAPAIRGSFRARSRWHARLGQRLEQSRHEEAAAGLQVLGKQPLAVVLRSGRRSEGEVPPDTAPRPLGYLPRSGAVQVGGGSRLDPFPETRLHGLEEVPTPGPVEVSPVLPGLLEPLELVGSTPEPALEELVGEAMWVMGLRQLDAPPGAQEGSRPELDLTGLVREQVLTQLAARGARFWVELEESTPRVAEDLAVLARLGAPVILRLPVASGRVWPEGLPRPEGALLVVASPGGGAERRALQAWVAGGDGPQAPVSPSK